MGWTVICSGGSDIRVYKRDCPAAGPAADLARCTFGARATARRFARFWKERQARPWPYRPPAEIVDAFEQEDAM